MQIEAIVSEANVTVDHVTVSSILFALSKQCDLVVSPGEQDNGSLTCPH